MRVIIKSDQHCSETLYLLSPATYIVGGESATWPSTFLMCDKNILYLVGILGFGSSLTVFNSRSTPEPSQLSIIVQGSCTQGAGVS